MDILRETWEQIAPRKTDQPFIAIRSDRTAEECLQLLTAYNIFAVPVIKPDEDKVIGIIDCVDICAAVIDFWDDYVRRTTYKTPKQLVEKTLKDTLVQDLMNQSGFNEFHPLASNASIAEVLETLTLPGMHRVPLIDNKGNLTDFITQREAFGVVFENINIFGKLFDTTVLESGVGNMAVKKIHKTQTVLEAFRLMVEKKVTAVPIIDDDDRFVGILSVTDIRLALGKKNNCDITVPIGKFLENVRNGETRPDFNKITGSLADPVREIVQKMKSNSIYRIFVTDPDNNRLTGVVTMSDVIKFLLRNNEDMKRKKEKSESHKVHFPFFHAAKDSKKEGHGHHGKNETVAKAPQQKPENKEEVMQHETTVNALEAQKQAFEKSHIHHEHHKAEPHGEVTHHKETKSSQSATDDNTKLHEEDNGFTKVKNLFKKII